MAWSIGLLQPKEPELMDAFLLAIGKALYFASGFESKCKYIIRTVKMVEAYESDDTTDIIEFSKSFKDKALGLTIQDFPLLAISDDEISVLIEAKNARNYLAHEAASFDIFYASEATILTQTKPLRENLRNLLAGDNLVSRWTYEIDEKEPAPREMLDVYIDKAMKWVFE